MRTFAHDEFRGAGDLVRNADYRRFERASEVIAHAAAIQERRETRDT
jgi:hypothetical protein